jgi:S-DNA-T family DNA segregation ATPase FtsK/SpoIIIE
MAWCQRELGRRHMLFSATGCRSLNDFNHYIQESEQKGESVKNPLSITPESPEELVPFSRIVGSVPPSGVRAEVPGVAR